MLNDDVLFPTWNGNGRISFEILRVYLLAALGLSCCRGATLILVGRRYSVLRAAGFSSQGLLLLRNTGSIGRAALGTVAHGLRCSMVCGILPDQGSNPWPLPWQLDS